jgi:nicotinamidase-related amidase
MLMDQDSSSLVLVDLQKRLMPEIYQGAKVVNQCMRIARIAELLNVPVIGTEQSPNNIGQNLDEIAKYCDKTIRKEHFNACLDGLIGTLAIDRPQVILAGCESHVCVMQTALGLIDADFSVAVIVDATGSRRALDRNMAFARMKQAGVILLTTEMLGFEWLKSARHRSFKEALEIFKET